MKNKTGVSAEINVPLNSLQIIWQLTLSQNPSFLQRFLWINENKHLAVAKSCRKMVT